jgi:hypothetical protein
MLHRLVRFVGRRFFLPFLLAILLPVLCFGQATTGTLIGTVSDASNLAIPGARVSATQKMTGEQSSATTDARGEYVLRGLLPGSYSVIAEKQGFKQAIVEDAAVVSEETLRVDVRLDVGAVTEKIVVTAAPPQLLTENSRLETVVSRESFSGLPFNGREIVDLLLLFPGVNEGTESALGDADNLSPTGGASTVSIAGGRIQSNVYLLNGTVNTDGRQNLMALHPSLDTVEEVSVNRSTNSAEFGRSGAGQVNIITRGGGNQLRGTLYEYFRNDALDARGFFSNLNNTPKEIRRQNQFGGTMGGPVILPRIYSGRDRTFFFAAFERSRIRIGQSGFGRVPTDAEARGDFSSRSYLIYDPLSTSGSTGARTAFPGNVIPLNRQSAIAQNVLNQYPAANIPLNSSGYNYYGTGATQIDNTQVNGRVDHRLSDRHNLSAIYFFNNRPYLTPRSVLPDHFNSMTARTQNATVTYQRIFSARIFNEAKFGFNRARYGQISNWAFQQDLAAKVGIPGGDETPVNWGIPTISILGGYTGLSDTTPTFRRNNTFQWVDNLSVSRGAHSLRIGAEIRRSQINNREDRGSRGSLTFTGVYSGRLSVTPTSITQVSATGDGLADLMMGFPSRASRAVGDSLQNYLRNTSWNFYANDDWKVTPRLTLNLGVRYELTPPYYDKYNQMVNTVIANGFSAYAKVMPGDRNPFDHSLMPRALVNTDFNNIAPRVGLAYRARRTTVLRAGYGIFYSTPPADIVLFNLVNQQPLVFNQGFSYDQDPQPRTRILTPSATLANAFSGPLTGFTSFGIQQNMRTPYSQQWNFNIQQQIVDRLTVEAAYVGSLSLKLEQQVALDRPTQQVNANGSIVLMPPVTQALWDNVSAPGGALMSMGGAVSNYHSLQLTATQRSRWGLSFLASYTFAKSIDNSSQRGGNTSSAGTAQNSLDLSSERSLSSFDVRHRFSFAHTYELPFGKGRRYFSRLHGPLAQALGGWSASGITTVSTGTPRTARSNSSLNRTGTATYAERPNATGLSSALPADQRTIDEYFNTGAYVSTPAIPGTSPVIYYFGNAGRNTITAPTRVNVDMSLLKTTKFSERTHLQFRAEAFNVFNITNWGLGSQSILDSSARPNPAFGRITFTQPHRKMQLSLRLSF